MTKPTKNPLKKVQRLVCPQCGELQIKIFPYSSMGFTGPVAPCIKCVNKANIKALVKR